jgi:argininosuccinate lyase
MTMWSGRFREPLNPAFERWQRSFGFDWRLLRHELAASRAHARALKTAGVLSSEELISILEGLDWIDAQAGSAEGAKSAFLQDDEAEDIHHFVEKQLAARIGDTGYKLHSGRSRNEQVATDLRLYTRESIDQLTALLADWVETFIARAESAGDASIPAYTHLQRAEPVLVGHWLLSYANMFLRDVERLTDCRKRVNLCPLGSGPVGGAVLPLDRAAMTSSLEFDAPTDNSIDATSDRELVRGKAARVLGHASTLMIAVKGLPLAYNKDLQETQEPLFDAAETVLAMMPLVCGFMKLVEFNHQNMQSAAESGFMNAWAASTYLVNRGVPFRMAHERIGKAVQVCLDRGCELKDLPLEDLQKLHPAFEASFYECLTLKAVLALHDVPGGTAPQRVRQAIAGMRQKVARLREGVHVHA